MSAVYNWHSENVTLRDEALSVTIPLSVVGYRGQLLMGLDAAVEHEGIGRRFLV